MQPNDFAQEPNPNEIIQKSSSGAILLPNNPSQDAIAAATGLYLALHKMGKNISIVCDSQVKADFTAADKIQGELTTSGDNLVISFPYTDGSIDKVDYNITGDTFNLVITPRAGQPKLNPQQVKYTYAGGLIDFIITVDAPNFNSLGQIYSENKNTFQGKPIINIDRHLVNDFFGTVNIVNKTSSSTCEMALQFLRTLNAEIDRDTATNLYAGITAATNNFTSYSVNADTFEAAAQLLKAGAVKKQVKKPAMPQQPGQVPQMQSQAPMQQPQAVQQPMQQNPQQFGQNRPQMNQPRPAQQPQQQQQPRPQQQVQQNQNNGQPKPIMDTPKPIEEVEQEAQPSEGGEEQDWLKPKIFRGTGLI